VRLVHAAARAGVVFVPLSPDAPERAVSRRCSAADVDVLVTTGTADENVTGGFDGPVFEIGELERSEPAPAPFEWDRDDVQWLVFTSGTTGRPRPVELTAGNLLASAAASARRLGVESTDRWLACLPMHHVGGLAPLIRTAFDGTSVVVQRGFHVDTTTSAIDDHDVTGISLVPTMLDRMLDAGWRPPASLRFVLLGGAPASAELVDRCESAGVPVCPTYGATEAASQIATATPEEAFEHRGTVGRPLEGIEVDIVDREDRAVADGEPGELVVSGPTVSPGYYGDPAATDARFDQGGFRTRDRGYRDDAGRLWIEGRLDDAITTGGVTVRADAVEAALRTHADVADVAVVGLDDEEWGQVVAALVTTRAGRVVDPTALRDHCRGRLEPASVPKRIEVAAELPRTASGTVDRAAVAERLREARRRGGL
jgi:O-succinylbenzoic acid--CoA ligase